ncbi:hypothetical protein OG875_20395 [Streptomyces sp. NBC_01498]|uniref:hypothetical protein n=1 Tax=Streptomyces sp. NBC_01498 TaxID=2975870 RepID=UPI002E7B1E56|nr:hypothetical protein [Streptomyces sp. NBC_01498]WTL26714.1 hypothetical protein OG875_20395 [Streptomyces sp. NBC_01498]
MKVFPYPTLAGEVSLQVTAVKQDQHRLSTSVFSGDERVVALHQVERSDWTYCRIGLTAFLPAKELDEGPWQDVAAVAVLTEKATNTRTTAVLRRQGDGTEWKGRLGLWRAAHLSRADLSVSVVATTDGVPGRVIGGSEANWVVDFTARSPVRRRELRINEVDFVDGPQEWLRPFKDAPWLVETSGELPTVHLNTGFEGVAELLNSGGGSLERAVRDMLATQIAIDVWTAVFHAAVSDLELDAEGKPEWPGGWRDTVLRGMLRDVLPGMSDVDALGEIYARRKESSGWNELLPRISYAAGRRAKVARNLGTTIRALDASQKASKA